MICRYCGFERAQPHNMFCPNCLAAIPQQDKDYWNALLRAEDKDKEESCEQSPTQK